MINNGLSTWIVIVALAAAILPGAAAFAQDRESFSGRNAFEYVRVLAGNDFEGRLAGLESGRRAGAWIADRFKEWGLEPAGTNGYFQEFTKPVFHIQAASLSVGTGAAHRTFAYEEEWRVASRSGSAIVDGELVFAGYGIVSEKAGWDDFAGFDLKGKIVILIPYGAPAFLAGKIEPWAMTPSAKIAKAYGLGARAVIVTDEPVDILTGYQRYPFPAGIEIEPWDFRPDLVVAGLNNDAVKAVFRDSGIDLYTRVQQIEKTQKPVSAALGIQGKIEVKTVFLPDAPLRNVLAKITGSDPSLREETIILGAHYDGLGLTPDGRPNPGADDNASGTAVVMEIARAMAAEKARPKRTVVFALWDGEEEGLWGSENYVRTPAFPLGKTLANINLDMVGNGDGGLQFRGVYFAPDIWAALRASLPASILENVAPTRGGFGGSDHTPFLANGVPGFYIQTTGDHFGRHNIGDRAALVDPALLEKSGILAQAAVGILAEAKDLKPQPYGRELNMLRASTITDLEPRDAAPLLKEAEAVEYPDLDFALVGVPGASPAELAKAFYDIAVSAEKAKKAFLYEPPASVFSNRRYGDRVGLIRGVTDLAALDGRDEVLRLLGRAGLGFIAVRDKDFDRGEEGLRRMIEAAEAEGVLVISCGTDAARSAKLVEWSARPGLLLADSPDAETVKKLKAKRWRLALDWKAGVSAEDYAAAVKKLGQEIGSRNLLLRIPRLSLRGFEPDLVKLMGLILPKELSEAQLATGQIGEFGQNLLSLLQELRPPKL